MNTNNNLNINEIANEVKRLKESSENFKNISHKEIIHHILEKVENDASVNNDNDRYAEKEQINIGNKNKYNDVNLPEYAKNSPEDSKKEVEKLINITFKDGLIKAIKLSKKKNPYIQDMFHDALVDKLYKKLKNNNLI